MERDRSMKMAQKKQSNHYNVKPDRYRATTNHFSHHTGHYQPNYPYSTRRDYSEPHDFQTGCFGPMWGTSQPPLDERQINYGRSQGSSTNARVHDHPRSQIVVINPVEAPPATMVGTFVNLVSRIFDNPKVGDE
jgi:hypothetical protein